MTKSPGATSVTSSPTASTTPGRLVAEEVGEVVPDAALAVVEVGVTHAAGLDAHQRLPRAGIRHQDRGDLDRRALFPGDHTLHALRHGYFLSADPGHRGRTGRGATLHPLITRMKKLKRGRGATTRGDRRPD